MTDRNYDVIIVGGGHNGLVCSTYLAKSGRKVLVLEANEKLGDKDFLYRLKIARKEAKESTLWLKLLRNLNVNSETELTNLLNEAEELRKILSTIINKS